ncbi:Prefoldin subunit 3 [Thelohanellus kitauei]|uniref:Prefoldin subunit 3 n=1 Tax=Thelohanellus kitauei TaxID=669202 RepID=A0A0C2MD00_THEKT|nr:Prefoldin subunit 3 [Thelohanellus kitauei]
MSETLSDELAEFVENESEFIAKEGQGDSKIVLLKLQKLLQYYVKRESALTERMSKFFSKISNNQESLCVVDGLENDSATETYFTLADQVFSIGTMDRTNKTVYLWLGANVMVEFSYEEARNILNENINDAKKLVEGIQTEMDLIKSKITTLEVNIARIHNFNVLNQPTKN